MRVAGVSCFVRVTGPRFVSAFGIGVSILLTGIALSVSVPSAGGANGVPPELFGDCNRFDKLIERPTGEILALGALNSCGADQKSVVVQFEQSGKLDRDFGTGGIVTPAGPGPGIELLLRDDGAVLLVQPAQVSAFDSIGQPLSGFGDQGVLTLDNGLPPVSGAAIGPGGKLLVAGVEGPVGSGSPSTTRFTADGETDPAFGSGGTAISALPLPPGGSAAGWSAPGAIAVDPTGRVYLGGQVLGSTGPPAVIRLTGNGDLDPTYGQEDDGVSYGEPDSYGSRYNWKSTGMKLLPDGTVKLLAVFGFTDVKSSKNGEQRVFSPEGKETSESFVPIYPVGFADPGRVLTVGIYDGPYSEGILEPYFNFSGWLPGSFQKKPESILWSLIGTGASRSYSAVQARDGSGFFVGGTAAAKECSWDSEILPCASSMVLVKVDNAGNFVDSFGQDRGITSVPGIHCQLGASSSDALARVSRLRCRRPLDNSFTGSVSSSKMQTARPSFRVSLKNLPAPSTTLARRELRVTLPAFISRRIRGTKGLYLKTGDVGGGIYTYSGIETKINRSGRTIEVTTALPVDGIPKTMAVGVKRGYLKRIPTRYLHRKIGIGLRLTYSKLVDYDDDLEGGDAEYTGSRVLKTRILTRVHRPPARSRSLKPGTRPVYGHGPTAKPQPVAGSLVTGS